MSNLSEQKSSLIHSFNQKKYNKVSKIYKRNKEFYLKEPEITKLAVTSEFYLNNYLQAENYLRNILTNFDTAEFNYLLGNIFKTQKKYELAIASFQKAIDLDKNYSAAYNNIANIYKNLKQDQKAIENYKLSIQADIKNFEAYYNLANLLKDKYDYKGALDNYKKVIKINPTFQHAYNNIGTIYSILGNFDESCKYFLKSITLNKYFAEPYKNYVQAIKIKKNDIVLKNLIEIIDQNKVPESEKEIFYYSLSKAYFDIQEDSLAFKYLKLANDLKLKKSNFSKKIQDKEFLKIKNFFKTNKLNINNLDKSNKVNPIFILGMPRSGTSLVEQIISNHSEVFGGGELSTLPDILNSINWQNYESVDDISYKIRDEYLKELGNLSEKKFITDKLPGNFKRIGFIVNSIPEAKIVHLERNPMAVCWSNYKSNFNNEGMSFTLRQDYIAEFYLSYKDIMAFWEQKYPDRIINLNYEELVNNFQIKVRELFEKLELDWEDQLYDFHKNNRPVHTASFKQVRSKIFKNSSEQWRKYETYLKPMSDILKKNNIIF